MCYAGVIASCNVRGAVTVRYRTLCCQLSATVRYGWCVPVSRSRHCGTEGAILVQCLSEIVILA